MSIAAALEANLRERVARNLDRTNVALVELIRAPINSVSGQLAAGVMVDVWQDQGDRFVSTARSLAPYSVYVDRGTGIFAGGGRIYPTSARALSFYWQKEGRNVAFRSVAGMPGQHFFEDRMAENFSSALNTAWSA